MIFGTIIYIVGVIITFIALVREKLKDGDLNLTDFLAILFLSSFSWFMFLIALIVHGWLDKFTVIKKNKVD